MKLLGAWYPYFYHQPTYSLAYFSIEKPNQFLDWKVSILKVLLTNRPLYPTDVDTNVIYKIELSYITFEFVYPYFVANQN